MISRTETKERQRFTVGPAKFCQGGSLSFAFYGNGEIAIRIMSADGEPGAVATVAMVNDPGDMPPVPYLITERDTIS